MFPHLTYGDISRILKGRAPIDPYKRQDLGLSVLLPAPACPLHGVVHVGRCPGKRFTYHDLYSIPPQVLRRMYEGRWDVDNEK